MLRVLGSPRRLCDAATRRELITAGGIGLFGGMTLPNLVQAETLTAEPGRQARQAGWVKPGKAKSVILLYLMGGPPQQDTFDLKPDSPAEVRGEFKPIGTSASGIEICELLPRTAKWMHRSAIVRSTHHEGGDHNTLPTLTGFNGPSKAGNITQISAQDPPSMGSVCEYLNLSGPGKSTYYYLPCYLGWGQSIRRPGPYGGFLGQQYDPVFTECDPKVPLPARAGFPQVVTGTPRLPALAPEITADRLSRRRSLRDQMEHGLRAADRDGSLAGTDRQYQRAFDLLTTPEARGAFDLSGETASAKERYGKSLFGESALIGRRLVEAGARFVTVTWDLFWERIQVDFDGWDTHTKNFDLLRNFHLPYFDLAYSALMQDLQDRGLLDETLVVVMGEMGRTPKINGNAGRDHWTSCYSVLFSGAGIRGGTVFGRSDAQAAYPEEDPVLPGDICATIYHTLGIDPEMPVHDASGRPFPVAHGGKPIRPILV
ncbi:MAG: DUF1501 domain-containing protein [Actinomycetota bacterium]